jgi:hypothetical protein
LQQAWCCLLFDLRTYFRFRNAESVQGTVLDVDRHGSSRHRRYVATIGATVGDEEIKERIPISSSSLNVGGVRSSSASLSTGDQIEIFVVPNGDEYDVAIADDVRDPWTELVWEALILGSIAAAMIMVVRK